LDEARGVTGPEPAPASPKPLWLDERVWAAGIVIIAVTAAMLAGRYRPPPPPVIPPAEWATAELTRLAELDPAQPSSADAVARFIREFLAHRYQLPVDGKTTAELLKTMSPVSPGSASAWQVLLERYDVARFANLGFTAQEWTAALQEARRLVAESLPVGEMADPSASDPSGQKT
jgi:hypothetical protein